MAKARLSAPMLAALRHVADQGGIVRAWEIKTNTSAALGDRGMLTRIVRLAGDDVQWLLEPGAEVLGTTLAEIRATAEDATHEEDTRRAVCPDPECARSFLGRNAGDARDRLEGHVSYSHLPASFMRGGGKQRGTQLSPERLAEVHAWLNDSRFDPAPVGVVTPERRVEIRRVVDDAFETPEQRAARHALNKPLTEAFNALRDEASVPAPTLADDVAALLTRYGTLCAEVAVQRDDRLAVEPFDRANEVRRQILDRIAGAVSQQATEADVVRCARRWYYENGFKPGYLPRHTIGSTRDLKLAVETLGSGS
jgi:hypothetical protein